MNDDRPTMTKEEDESTPVDRALVHTEQMLRNRGYRLVDSEHQIYESSSSSNDPTPKRIKVFVCIDSKLNIERIKAYIQELEACQILHAIILYDDVITSSCKKIFEYMVRFEFETFHLDRMQYDITQHVLYNPHEKLTKDEIDRLRMPVKKFPVILKSDPVCRYFHFQKGDILRVRRKDGVVVYRIVR